MDLSMIPIVLLATFLILSSPQQAESGQNAYKNPGTTAGVQTNLQANKLPEWNKTPDYTNNIKNLLIIY